MPEFDLDVLVIGGSGVDTIVRVPQLDMPLADSHMVPMVQTRVGHTGDNVALGCRALGLRTRLVDFLGNDAEGRMVREHHEDAGLLCGWAIGGITKRAANLVDPAGRRMSFYDTRTDADARLPDELWLSHAGRSRHVHVSITHPSQFVLRGLPSGPSISTDLHNWDGLNQYHLEFAEAADIVFLSIAALPEYERSMRQILRGRAHVVVATAGADGCYLMTEDGPLRHFPAAPVFGDRKSVV